MRNARSALRPFEAALLPMLVEVAGEAVAPTKKPLADVRRLSSRLAIAALVVIGLVFAVPLASDDPLRGALAIKERGDVIIVSVKDASADPEAMTNDLRARGLPANVEVVPVSPSLEGVWVDIVNDNLAAGYNDPRISDIFRQITDRPRELEIPANFSTPFTLLVGRPAEPGEKYRIALGRDTEAAYECLGLAGLTPAEVNESLTARGYEPLWYYAHSDMPYTEVLDGVPVDKVIVGAEFLGPRLVIVHTDDPGGHATRAQEADSKDPAPPC